MAASLFPRSLTQVINTAGRKAAGALVYFFEAGTTTPRTVYTDDALAVPQAHPVVCDANGIIPAIYLPYGSYRVRVTTSTGTVLSDIDNIENAAPPDSGGGGGIVVSEADIHQTGDIIIAWSTAARTGAVRLNGNTIGSAASGATERANADTADLFTFCWNNFSDFYCPVSGGRGASAAADFAANKTLTLLSGQGKALFGSDTMGGTVANISQRSTTINTTNGSPTITVASAAGLYAGMQVVSADIPAGTTILVISGTTVTLSANATATTGGLVTAARFSTFRDAQVPGASGGDDAHTLSQRELPIDLGTATTTVINGTDVFRGGTPAQSGTGSTAPSIISEITATTTITNALGGSPHNNIPPGLVVYFFQKL